MAIPPGFHADPLDQLTRTRTSTRPPPPPHPTPCTYRTAYVSCCIRSSTFIRRTVYLLRGEVPKPTPGSSFRAEENRKWRTLLVALPPQDSSPGTPCYMLLKRIGIELLCAVMNIVIDRRQITTKNQRASRRKSSG